MNKFKINNTDLEVSRINFGGNVFGWTLNEKQSFAIADQFTEAGFNFFDTADTYPWWVNGTGGLSESILGKTPMIKLPNYTLVCILRTKIYN